MTDRQRERWRKSSRSYSKPACVELFTTNVTVAVRDSKHPVTTLRFQPHRFSSFLGAVKEDRMTT